MEGERVSFAPGGQTEKGKKRRETCLRAVLLLAFLCFSLVCLAPGRGRLSSLLEVKITEEENRIIYDFTDADGRAAFASDAGFGREIDTIDDNGRIIEERYYDESGRPVVTSDGYFCIRRTYAEDGKSCRITFYDAEDEPTAISYGADEVQRTFRRDGEVLVETDRYYRNGRPITHSNGSYGYRRVYRDGLIREGTTLDRDEAPMNTWYGYSTYRRQYLSDGSIRDMYYDEDGSPGQSRSGDWGAARTFDSYGRVTMVTCLDASGNPAPNKNGVVYEVIEYLPEGEKTMYLGPDKEPVDTGHGVYGILYTNDLQVVNLDAKGRRIPRLDNLLTTMPVVTVLTGSALTVLAFFLTGRRRRWFIILYMMFIVLMTLMFRDSGNGRVQLTLFWSYRKFFYSTVMRREILFNWWLFVPLGAALKGYGAERKNSLFSGREWLACTVCSVIIEVLQLVTGRGLFELDDILSNTMGGLIGWLAAGRSGEEHRPESTEKSSQPEL